nr:stage V sporulation protein AC [uncultured Solibaculum sp.]
MKVTNQEYSQMTDKTSPNSPKVKNVLLAFLVGGLICTIGQAIQNLWILAGLPEQEAKMAVSCTLIFLSAALTGLGLYDKLAKHAGAGTLVPITGFANAIVSPAIEFKSEGYITGLGAKMFVVAGPVLVFGISASVVYGIILYICNLF